MLLKVLKYSDKSTPSSALPPLALQTRALVPLALHIILGAAMIMPVMLPLLLLVDAASSSSGIMSAIVLWWIV
jgi:hypothetical protein